MYYFKVKDPISSLTHFIGFVFAILGSIIILCLANYYGKGLIACVSISIFMLSMIILYGASTTYHTFNLEKYNYILKKIDHSAIFVLIAGSYTPVCVLVFHNFEGYLLLAVVWLVAILGIIFKLCFINCPKYVSSVLYIAMGWLIIFKLPLLLNTMATVPLILLVIGGVLYTVGGVIYALKPKIFKNETVTGFGNHELFHIFVLLGSLFHFLMCCCLLF